LQWEGDYEAANWVFEEYDKLGAEELDDLQFNIETSQALGLRMIGKLNQAKYQMQSTLSRLEKHILEKEKLGKDTSGQVNKKGRVLRILAILISHESLLAAAELLQRAGGSGDQFALTCVEVVEWVYLVWLA
jgi:hypothetical protein